MRTNIKINESFTNDILNASGDPIFVKNSSCEFVAFNEAFRKMLEIPEEEIFGKTLAESLFKDEMEHFLKDDREVLNSGKENLSEETLTLKNGERLIILTKKTRYTNEQGEDFIVGVIHDITQRKKYEEEFQRYEKLESIGRLAGGIAHDFNNILMGLFGYISSAKDELSKDDNAFVFLEKALESMNRAVSLTNQLLTFSKGGEPAVKDFDLGVLIKSIAPFHLSGSNVKLIYNQPEDLWNTRIDSSQIEQVVSNLVINAFQAMPSGGHLSIFLENVEILEKNKMETLLTGKYVKATFKDEGIGIEPKHLSKIFDPYFTTKQKGTGLGLATAYSIIKKHNGEIKVESELGKGSTFVFYLPAAETQVSIQDEILSSEKQTYITKTPKVLVLDDELFIREITPRWLKKIGCIVFSTEEGKEVVEKYKEALSGDTPFDLLILDLTIPGQGGGQEVLEEILAFDPKVKAIASSGYSESAVMAKYSDYGFKAALPKPYTQEKLQEIVKEVLKM